MNSNQEESLKQLQEIKRVMNSSVRFISLSGWSGICAGLFACLGSYIASIEIDRYYTNDYIKGRAVPSSLQAYLIGVALVVFALALLSAFYFTYRKSKKDGVPFWGGLTQRLLWNTFLPIGAGGLFILSLIMEKEYKFVAPACLLFYGLGLVNGSKYTLGEIRYLGYIQILLGLLNLLFPNKELLFWTLGFGVAHIVYGLLRWWQEKKEDS